MFEFEQHPHRNSKKIPFWNFLSPNNFPKKIVKNTFWNILSSSIIPQNINLNRKAHFTIFSQIQIKSLKKLKITWFSLFYVDLLSLVHSNLTLVTILVKVSLLYTYVNRYCTLLCRWKVLLYLPRPWSCGFLVFPVIKVRCVFGMDL